MDYFQIFMRCCVFLTVSKYILQTYENGHMINWKISEMALETESCSNESLVKTESQLIIFWPIIACNSSL